MSPNSRATPRLETARLVIRLPSLADVPQIVAYVTRNREFHAATRPAPPPDFEQAKYWLERVAQFWEEFEADRSLRLYLFARSDNREVCGTATLSQIQRGPLQACYLGYALDQRHQGTGLMFEALGAIVEYAFGSMNLHRIMANYMPTNERSGRLLARLGFVIEGYARDYLLLDGQWRDHVLTSRVNRDWRA